MATASGALVALAYVAESTRGTTPASPAFTALRLTAYDVNLEKDVLESEEVRADRQVADVRHGFQRVSGTLPFELSLAAFDDLLEWAMGGTWVVATQVTNVAAVAATHKFTRASGSFVTDGYRVGDFVTVAGFAASGNNGQFRVSSLTATDLVIDGTLTDEAADVSQTIDRSKRVSIGTTLKTWSLERAFTDIGQFQVFTGVACKTLNLQFRPTAIVKGVATIIGMSAAAMASSSADSDSTYTDAPTNRPMAAFQGALYENGSEIGVVTGADITLENGRMLESVVGSVTSPDVFEGQAMLSGEITVMFQNATMFNKFVNETISSLLLRVEDPDDSTKFIAFNVPRVLYTGAAINPPKNGPVILRMPFRGLRDSVSGTTFSIQRSNA